MKRSDLNSVQKLVSTFAKAKGSSFDAKELEFSFGPPLQG